MRTTIRTVAAADDTLVEHEGAVLCLRCFHEEVRGSLHTYDFDGPATEECYCRGCRRWGNKVFAAVRRQDIFGLPAIGPAPA
ncbi:MAG: hypothetical protein ACYSX0_04030 [Planctomycetota bacterium]|jgi:hypothetical protein